MATKTSIHISKELFDEIKKGGETISIVTVVGANNKQSIATRLDETTGIYCLEDGFDFLLDVGIVFTMVDAETMNEFWGCDEAQADIFKKSFKYYIVTDYGYEPHTPTQEIIRFSNSEVVTDRTPREIEGEDCYFYVDVVNGVKYYQVVPRICEMKNPAKFELLGGNVPVFKVANGSVMIVVDSTGKHAYYNSIKYSAIKTDAAEYDGHQLIELEYPASIPEREYGEFHNFYFNARDVHRNLIALQDTREEAEFGDLIKSAYIRDGYKGEPILSLSKGFDVNIRSNTLFKFKVSGNVIHLATSEGLTPIHTHYKSWRVEQIIGVVNGNPWYLSAEYVDSEHIFPEGTKLFTVASKVFTIKNWPSYDRETHNLKMAINNVVYVREPTKEYVIMQLDGCRMTFSAEPYFKYCEFDLCSL